MTNIPHPPTEQIYHVNVRAVEVFEDGALVLHPNRFVVALNSTAHFILKHTDGARTAAQIADLLARTFEIAHDEALTDVLALYEGLVTQNVVDLSNAQQSSKGGNDMSEVLYVRNPDVGLREEDEDGGLLFNPDTNRIQIVNTTGLFIWKLCDGSHTVDEIVSALQHEYEDAPRDMLTEDVQSFIADMSATGFIGTVEQVSGEGVHNV